MKDNKDLKEDIKSPKIKKFEVLRYFQTLGADDLVTEYSVGSNIELSNEDVIKFYKQQKYIK